LHALAAVLLAASGNTGAGCIGPVIMGECRGKTVPWETGGQGTDIQRREPDSGSAPPHVDTHALREPGFPVPRGHGRRLDHFYGRDPRDSGTLEPQEHQGRFR
jgi:hypothetical protein